MARRLPAAAWSLWRRRWRHERCAGCCCRTYCLLKLVLTYAHLGPAALSALPLLSRPARSPRRRRRGREAAWRACGHDGSQGRDWRGRSFAAKIRLALLTEGRNALLVVRPFAQLFVGVALDL